MHKYLVVSDTHGHDDNFYRVLDIEEPLDGIIHCGDFEGSEGRFALAADCPVYFVSGNNDFFSSLNRELEFELDGHRAFLTHGHNYLVSMDLENIKAEGISRGADLIFFGHTHRPVARNSQGVWLFNPGSLSYPRQEGRRPSYLILCIGDDRDISPEIKYL
ncbi:MAG: metallophosphoesterase [Butyrivibrio sp.]|nr:metallophosphoesterase [Butyrivibrio sp.]